MSPEIRLSVPCPSGVDEVRIAALLVDPSDVEAGEHLLTCSVCAERYFDHVAIRAAARHIVAESSVATAARASAGIRSLRFRKVPMAAVILVGVAGLAAAGAAFLLRPVIVAPGSPGLGRVADIQTRSGLDFSHAHLPPEAVVQGWTSFVSGAGGVGTVVSATTGGGMEVAGFDERGGVLWTATDKKWPGIAEAEPVFVRGIGTVVSRKAGDVVEERLWVTVERYGIGGLYIADPMSGECSGRYLHRGPLAESMARGPSVQVLPGGPGPRRRLLVTGQHVDVKSPYLCLSVVECDGTRVQHVTLPTLGISGLRGPIDVFVRVDWTPENQNVSVESSEGIEFRIPLVDGRLDTAAAKAFATDNVRVSFENANRATGKKWDDWVNEHGGPPKVLDDLARDVREADTVAPDSMRGR